MDVVLKMQESSFRSNLWEAVERLMVRPDVRSLQYNFVFERHFFNQLSVYLFLPQRLSNCSNYKYLMQFIKRKDNSSLEDFLISVKECGAATRGNKVKILTASTTDSEKKHSAASTTLLDKKRGQCRVSFHFCFIFCLYFS